MFACVPVPRVCESKHKRISSLATKCAFRSLVLCEVHIDTQSVGSIVIILAYAILPLTHVGKMQRCSL